MTGPVSREKLYEEVWAQPMTSVAARYGVSGTYLATVCARLKIPRPARGHWAQAAVGRASPRPPLPQPKPGDELEWSRDGTSKRHQPLPQPPALNEKRVTRSRTELPHRHALLVGARELFLDTRRSDDGYLRPMKHVLMDLYVSKDLLGRGLQAANELYLELERRGHSVALAPTGLSMRRPALDEREVPSAARYLSSWSPARPTVSYFGTVAIGLTVFEISEHVEVKYIDGKYIRVGQRAHGKLGRPQSIGTWTHKRDMASGRLCVRAFSPYADTEWQKTWKEGAGTRLETMIPRIIEELSSIAPAIAQMAEDAEKRAETRERERQVLRQKWEQEQLERARIEADRKRAESERQSRDHFLNIVESWHVARLASEFLDTVERLASTDETVDSGSLRNRVEEARRLLKTMDVVERFRTWKSPGDS